MCIRDRNRISPPSPNSAPVEPGVGERVFRRSPSPPAPDFGSRPGVTNPWPFPRAEALPTYAFVATDAVKKKAIEAGADLIDLGLGNPDRPTPQAIVDQLHAAADIGKNHRYHPGRGLPALRSAFGRWYERRYQTRFDVDSEVLVTMGAKEGISHLCLAILDRGDTAVVPDPCYPIHEGAPAIAGAAVVGYSVAAELEPAKALSLIHI